MAEKKWAYTYRIANFSVGGVAIRSPVRWSKKAQFEHRQTLFKGDSCRIGKHKANPSRAKTTPTPQSEETRAIPRLQIPAIHGQVRCENCAGRRGRSRWECYAKQQLERKAQDASQLPSSTTSPYNRTPSTHLAFLTCHSSLGSAQLLKSNLQLAPEPVPL